MTPVEVVRWCRLPFHKRAPLFILMDQGMSCQWAMASRLKTPRKNGPGNVFGSLPGLAKFPRPTLQPTLGRPLRGTWEATERLCDDRDSIAHRRREVQDPSPKTRLTTRLLQTSRRHACIYKRGRPPTCLATQPTQPTAPLLAPHKRSNQAQLPKAHPPPRAPESSDGTQKLLWGTSSSRTA